ncbi:MAG: helix-turn-helix transcriptional regulator [Bacteroidia bacterium]|nr:helix-turn-helix transcriptional regulator [Bacteroidia bacterium]
MHLGTKIKIARISKGLTQQALADKIGKTRPLISSIEQTGNVNHYTLMDISKALHIDVENIQTNSLNEPLPHYKHENHTKESNTDTEQLKNENLMLKELVELQKEVIRLMKEQLIKKKS